MNTLIGGCSDKGLLFCQLINDEAKVFWIRGDQEEDKESEYQGETGSNHHEPLPLMIKNFDQNCCKLDTENVSCVITGRPEANEESSVLLWEPVSHDCDAARKEKGVVDSKEDLGSVEPGFVIPIEESWNSKHHVADTEVDIGDS